MNLALAHGRFALMLDRGDVIENISAELPEAPVVAAALASCSGGLEDLPDLATDAELIELLRHGWTLYEVGVLTIEKWGDAAEEVFAALESAVLGNTTPEDAN